MKMVSNTALIAMHTRFVNLGYNRNQTFKEYLTNGKILKGKSFTKGSAQCSTNPAEVVKAYEEYLNGYVNLTNHMNSGRTYEDCAQHWELADDIVTKVNGLYSFPLDGSRAVFGTSADYVQESYGWGCGHLWNLGGNNDPKDYAHFMSRGETTGTTFNMADASFNNSAIITAYAYYNYDGKRSAAFRGNNPCMWLNTNPFFKYNEKQVCIFYTRF